MNIRFKFMKFRKIAAIVSIVLFLLSIISLGFRGLSLGLDFSGGTLIEVSYEKPIELQSIRDTLEDNGYPNSQVVNFGTNLDVLIKVSDQSGNSSIGESIFSILDNQLLISNPTAILDIDALIKGSTSETTAKVVSHNSEESILIFSDLSGAFIEGEVVTYNLEDTFTIIEKHGGSLELKRVEFVGSQIGDEFLEQGTKGALTALFMILMYVAFRFQYKFAFGAVTALAHDVIIILGLFSFFRWDFDLTVLAALLAVIGYSLNDTIVVSDRIRENFRTDRVLEPVDLVDLSLNQTLGRTIVTSFTTLLVLFALFIFGGELLRGFSLALILGVLVGTYSSIYVVANILIGSALTQEDLAVPEVEGADFDDGMP
tara:strand:- start:1615 stop:2730 length:1116 start_codon:yes stop_codon:yes gene_type:complete